MKFLINHWSEIIVSLSLAISFYSLYKNRIHIDAQWNKNIEEVPIDGVFLLQNGKETPLNYAYFTHLNIINSSPRDIRYFDLSAFNPDTKKSLYLLTKKTLGFGFEDATVVKRDDTGREMRLDIPNSNAGILRANSITKLDLVVVLTGVPDDIDNLSKLKTIAMSFRIPKYVLFNRDRFTKGIFRKYWYKGMLYHITDWQLRRSKQRQLQSVQSEHVSAKQSRFPLKQTTKALRSLLSNSSKHRNGN